MSALPLAFGLLTAVRVRRLPAADRVSAGRAVLLAPVTVLPLLVLVGGAGLAVAAGAPALVLAGLVLAAGVLYTRALHLDGLADTADGLSAGYDPATSLTAMKASDTGPSGVTAIVLVVLVQAAALAELLATAPGVALAALAWLVSRAVLAWACRTGVPAAQPEGLGALVAGSVGWPGLAAATLVTAALATGLGALPGLAWWHGPLVAALGLGAGAVLVGRVRARLGGVTGDVLGATVEVALASALVTAAVLVA